MAEVLLTVTARVVGSSDSVGTYNIIAVSTHKLTNGDRSCVTVSTGQHRFSLCSISHYKE